MEGGFYIDNLDKFEQRLLQMAKIRFPAIVQNTLDSLGEILIGEAKDILRNKNTSHARYAMSTKTVTRGINKGKTRNYLQYKGSASTNSVNTGRLWNSLSRGASGNVWRFNGASGKFSLCVGSSVDYAKLLNDGYKMFKSHWVPGVIDGSGKFIYQRGAKTGIYVKARVFNGLKYFDIGFEEMKKIAPDIIRRELERFKEEFNAS